MATGKLVQHRHRFSQATKERLGLGAEPDDRVGIEKTMPRTIRPDQWVKIADMLRVGGTLKDAAAIARISHKRLERNLEAEVHLRRDVAELMAECKKHHLTRIYDGVRGWQASAWFLERIYRREYALHMPDSSDEERAIQVRKMVRRQGPLPTEKRAMPEVDSSN